MAETDWPLKRPTSLNFHPEACDQLHEGLYRFRDESLIWYNLACYACVLGDKARARKMLDKAIELGGDKVKLRALDDPDLLGVWVSGGN